MRKLTKLFIGLIAFLLIAVFFQNCGADGYVLMEEFQSKKAKQLTCDLCTLEWQKINDQNAPDLSIFFYSQSNEDGILVWQQSEANQNGSLYYFSVVDEAWYNIDSEIKFRSDVISVGGAGKIVFWGGAEEGNYFEDGFIFETTTKTISKTSMSQAPVGRSYAASVIIDGKMYLWGGYNGSYLSSGAVLDLSSNQWSELPATNLSARANHKMINANGKLVIWGGYNQTDANQEIILLNDGAVFEIGTEAWSLLEQNNTIAGRLDFTLAYNSTFNSLIVIGGIDLQSKGNGVEVYSFADKGWTNLLSSESSNEVQVPDYVAVSSEYVYIWSSLSSSIYLKSVLSLTSLGWGEYPELTDVDFVPIKVYVVQDKFMMLGHSTQDQNKFVGYYISR